MQFSKDIKMGWWFLTLIIGVVLLQSRWHAITSGSTQTFDTILLTAVIALALLPFFSELSIYGLSLKQYVEETKKEIKQDVKEQIFALKTDLHNAIITNNQVNPNINVYATSPPPPPDNQLSELERQIQARLEEFREELGIAASNLSAQELRPSENTTTAFSSRYMIERELRRIWRSRFQKPVLTDSPSRISIGRMVDELVKTEIIPPSIGRSIREVYSVASPAVHGDEPSPEQITFLTDVVPPLLVTLKAIR